MDEEEFDIYDENIDEDDIDGVPGIDAPKKRSKAWIVVLIVLLTIFIVIPAAVVGGVYIIVSDNTSAKYESKFEHGVDTQTLIYDKFLSALDNIDEPETIYEGKIFFVLTQDDFNEILTSNINGAIGDVDLSDFNLGYSLAITDDYYDIYVSGGYKNIINTRARVRLKLDFIEDGPSGDGRFEFSVVSVQIGKLGGLETLAKKYLPSILEMNGVDLGTMMKDAGFNMTFDAENLKLVYPKADFLNDIKTLIGGGETSSDDPMMILLNDIFERDIIDIDFNADKTLRLVIDLRSFHGSNRYGVDADDPAYVAWRTSIDYDGVIAYLKYLYDEQFLNTEDDVANLLTFFLKGYCYKNGKSYSDTVKNWMDDFAAAHGDGFFSDKRAGAFPAGIPSIVGYYGDEVAWYDSLYDSDGDGVYAYDEEMVHITSKMDNVKILVPSSFAFLSNEGDAIAWIEDVDLTGTLRCQDLFAQITPIVGEYVDQVSNGKYHIDYFGFDDIYAKITDNHLAICIGLSLNGYECNITVVASPAAEQPAEKNKFKLDFDNVYIGYNTVSQGFKDYIYDMLGDTMESSEDEFFYIDNSGSVPSIIINGAKVINDTADQVEGNYAAGVADLVVPILRNMKLDLCLEGDNNGVGRMLFRVAA